jgi:hypothetical protein
MGCFQTWLAIKREGRKEGRKNDTIDTIDTIERIERDVEIKKACLETRQALYFLYESRIC